MLNVLLNGSAKRLSRIYDVTRRLADSPEDPGAGRDFALLNRGPRRAGISLRSAEDRRQKADAGYVRSAKV